MNAGIRFGRNHSLRKNDPPLNNFDTAWYIYNYTLSMIIYLLIMLICLRTLFGEQLKQLKLLLNHKYEIYQ